MPLRLHAVRVAASALATVLLLYTLTGAYAWQAYDRPLARALERHPDVASFSVRSEDGTQVVEVRIRDVANLREAYLRVDRAVAGALRGPYRLVVKDRRDDTLVAAYYAVHLDVAEAVSRGSFAAAAERIERRAREAGVQRIGFYVDERHAYLQLHRGDRYLYEVVERPRQEVR